MCLYRSVISSILKWNWDGDILVNDPILPATRVIPGRNLTFDVDLREFLATRSNAVLHRAIDKIVNSLSDAQRRLWYSYGTGSYDLRVQATIDFFASAISYTQRGRGFDNWLYPEETLALGTGDCEDRSFLFASLLLSSGISPYNIRVSLGEIVDYNGAHHDHVWVMYKSESGRWMLLDPSTWLGLNSSRTKELFENAAAADPTHLSERPLKYTPYLLFNNDHAWVVRGTDKFGTLIDRIAARKFWTQFNPAFGTPVHDSILLCALGDLAPSMIEWLKLFSAIEIDGTKNYDPRDHFDNSFIMAGKKSLNININSGTHAGLALACHAIADFYAHSTYSLFSKAENGQIDLWDGTRNTEQLAIRPDYGINKFRILLGGPDCDHSIEDTIQLLNDQVIISGKFGSYASRSPFSCLPHHDSIAFDSPLRNGLIPSAHTLTTDPGMYQREFDRRVNAAVRHVRLVYEQWRESAHVT